MMSMMTLDVSVTPTEETKAVGEWTARRFDVVMTSKMMTMEAVMWATQHPDLDMDAYYAMYEHISSMQPGMANLATEMRKVNGLVVEQQAVMTMKMGGDVTVNTSERVEAIEVLDPPAGIYDPPQGYTEKPFDFMASLQR
jgi:hypothetical protein